METNTNQQIADALMRCEEANSAADKAIEARDRENAPALILETMALTLDALAMCARAGSINPLENLLPNCVYYVRVLQALDVDPFDAVKRLPIGSSI